MRIFPKFLLQLLLILLLYNCESSSNFKLKEGDILFQDGDCGPFCDAIEAVTQGVDNYNFSHVGLVMEDEQGQLKVMEAVSAGVVLTPLDIFLNRSFDENEQPKVVVGRLKPEYKQLIPGAIFFIDSKMDAEYDGVFDLDNDKYYCSELIHLAFKYAYNDTPIFDVQPMTFKIPNTDRTFGIWETYFIQLNEEVPEGQLGLNPAGMSHSDYIDIVHFYGTPSSGSL